MGENGPLVAPIGDLLTVFGRRAVIFGACQGSSTIELSEQPAPDWGNNGETYPMGTAFKLWLQSSF